MSSALAIAGVTAVLRDLLNDGFIHHKVAGILGSSVTVSVGPPDHVVPAGATEASQINLFMHQVTPNLGWRNEGLPSRDGSGRQRLANAPLALNLHYLLSTYGSSDLHTEILLGYAMQLLHENPVLTRGAIRAALKASPSGTPALLALADSGLENQIEQIKITPEYLSSEEMSKLWTAIQSHFRPTAAYMATVVLIEANEPTRAPLPVLTRGRFDATLHRDEGVVVTPGLVPPYPTLESALVATHATPGTVQLGDVVTVHGHHLAGKSRAIVLSSDRFSIERAIVLADETDDSDKAVIVFTVPNLPADLPVGMYSLELRVQRPGDLEVRMSNALPVALAPVVITSVPPTAVTRIKDVLSVHVGCKPNVRVGQKASLLMDTREAPAKAFTTDTATLDFEFPHAPPPGGTPLLRLKVDGIESIVVNRAAHPPAFFKSGITLP